MARALIVGGGVIGLPIAYELAGRGLEVKVRDRPMRDGVAEGAP